MNKKKYKRGNYLPAIEHFITKKIKKNQVDEYFAQELKRAGYFNN